jgi:putative hydrolase of the HAD superfamily
MKPPRAVVFDLGKVLVDFDYRIAADRFSRLGGCPADELMKLFDHSPLLLRYETGQMTTAEFFAAARGRVTGLPDDAAVFAGIFADIFSPIKPMIELHAALRRRRIPTYIFSNTNEMAVRHIREKFPFFHRFEGYILSYEQGSMKPQAPIYEEVERQARLRGPELLYLDDREENAQAGRARGWQVIHHACPETTLAEVKRLGLI